MIILVQNNPQVQTVASLASEIWIEYYTSIIGSNQVKYMLDKIQSFTAIDAQIKNEGFKYFLIEDDGIAIGYIAVQLQGDALYLSKLYVRLSERNKGFGKKAIDFVENLAVENKLIKIFLNVNRGNHNSIKAYEKLGFVATEEVEIDIGEGYLMCDYRMEKLVLPEGIKVLILAPHPDDFDAIGVTLKKFHQCGSQISLAVISEAASGVEDSFMIDYPGKTKAEIREKEQIKSCLFFGLFEENISFLHLQEDDNGDPIEDAGNFQLIEDQIIKVNPDIIFLPHGNDTNQGHIRTYSMCVGSIRKINKSVMLFLNRDPKTIEMRNDLYIVFDKKEAAWKAELLLCHKSQHQRNLNQRKHGFDERVLAVNREIAAELPKNYEYAEVFEIEERNAEQTLSAPGIEEEEKSRRKS